MDVGGAKERLCRSSRRRGCILDVCIWGGGVELFVTGFVERLPLGPTHTHSTLAGCQRTGGRSKEEPVGEQKQRRKKELAREEPRKGKEGKKRGNQEGERGNISLI